MRLTVVGCGDAFGSGGRANTCFLIDSRDVVVALDFGATSVLALKRLQLSASRIDLVVLSHLHGDHFGGLPFLLLEGQFEGQRERPLTIVGPPGTGERLNAALEVFFPGSTANQWRYRLEVVDLPCLTPYAYGHLEIETREVVHPSGAASTGVRIGGTEALLPIADGADLFITECYTMDGAPKNHLDFATIEANRARLATPRVMLTHMSEAVLRHLADLEAKGYVIAHDGLVLAI